MEALQQLPSQPPANGKPSIDQIKPSDMDTSGDEDLVNNNLVTKLTKDAKSVQPQNSNLSQIVNKSNDGVSSMQSQYDPSKNAQNFSTASQQYSSAPQQYSTGSINTTQPGSTFNGNNNTNANYQQSTTVNTNTYNNQGQASGNWNSTNQGTATYSSGNLSSGVNQISNSGQMNTMNGQNSTFSSAASGGIQTGASVASVINGMQKNPTSFSYSNTTFSNDIGQMINSTQNYSASRQNISSTAPTNGVQNNPTSFSYSNTSLSSFNQMPTNGQSNTMTMQNGTAASFAMGGAEKKQKTAELENNSVTAIAAMKDSQMPKYSTQGSQLMTTINSSMPNNTSSISNNSITMPGSSFAGTSAQSMGGQASSYGGNFQLSPKSGNYQLNSTSGSYQQNAPSGNYQQNSTSANYQQNSTSGNYQLSPKSGGFQQSSQNGNYQLSPTSGGYKSAPASGTFTLSPTNANYQSNLNSGNYNQSPTSAGMKNDKESPKGAKQSLSNSFTDQLSGSSAIPNDQQSVAKLYEMYQSSLAHISELRSINEKMSKENSDLMKQGSAFTEIKQEPGTGLAIQDNDPLAVKKLKKLLENSICTNAANKVHLLAMEEKLKANTGQNGNMPAGGGAYDPNTMRKINEMTEKMRKAITEINQLKMVNDRISKENEKLTKEEGRVTDAAKVNKDKEQKYMEIEMRHVELKEVNKRLVENLKNSLDRIKKMKAEASRQVESKSSILLRKLACVLIAQLNPSLSREGILHFLGSSENISTFLNRQPEEQKKLFESIPLFQKFKDFSSEDENIAKNMTSAFDSEDDGGAMIKLLKEGSGAPADASGKAGDSNSSTRCALCPMKWKGKFMKTSPPFLMHLLDKHFKKLFDSIPNDSKEYVCEYEPCGYVTPLRFGLIYHLSSRHMELEKLLKKEKMDPNVLFPVWGEKKEAPAGQANTNNKPTPSAKGGDSGKPVSISSSDDEGEKASKMMKKVMKTESTARSPTKQFGLVKYGKDKMKMSPDSRSAAAAGKSGSNKSRAEDVVCTPSVQNMTSDDEIQTID